MKLTHYTATGTKSTTTVSDSLFGAKVNKALLSQVLYIYMSNKRQGTSKTKTRSEVDVSHKKIYAQKGTGNARHGSKNAPIFVGGGRAHGPTGMQNWSKDLSKNMKQAALISALSAQAENIVIHEGLASLTGKTGPAATLINAIESKKRVLVVLAEQSDAIERSLRNIPHVTYISAELVNAHEIARAHKIILTVAAIEVLEKRVTKKAKDAAETVKAVKAPKAEVATEVKASAKQNTTEKKTTTKAKTKTVKKEVTVKK